MGWKDKLSKLKFWKSSKKEMEKKGEAIKYVVKEKPPDGRWSKAQEFYPEQLEKVLKREGVPVEAFLERGYELLEDLNGGYKYKCVEILDENNTHGDTLWEHTEPSTIDKTRDVPSQPSGSDEGLVSVNTERLDGLQKDIKELGQVASAVGEIQNSLQQVSNELDNQMRDNIGGNSGNGGNREDSDIEYEGKVPSYLHPDVMKQGEKTLKEVIDFASEKFNPMDSGSGPSDKEGKDIEEDMDEILED